MNEPKEFLFKEGFEEEHLHSLRVLGTDKPVYDSVSACNRCAYCSRSCPVQLSKNLESLSPRGRNQAVRLVMEGKLNFKKDKELLSPTLHTCLLCGACTRECFAKVPTHEHVLELERATVRRTPPFWLKFLVRLLENKKYKQETKDPLYFYLPSFETKFFYKDIYKKTLSLLQAKGAVQPLFDSTGMFDYIYGSLVKSKKKALKLIKGYKERFNPKHPQPLVTDSLEVYAFIKKYPQIFLNTEHYDSAVLFAEQAVFISDIIKNTKKADAQEKILLSKTNAFSTEDSLFSSTEENLKNMFKNFIPVCRGQTYPVPSLGYQYIFKKASAEYIKEKIKFLAESQADIIVLCSPIQRSLLKKWSKKYYPKIRVVHISEIL